MWLIEEDDIPTGTERRDGRRDEENVNGGKAADPRHNAVRKSQAVILRKKRTRERRLGSQLKRT